MQVRFRSFKENNDWVAYKRAQSKLLRNRVETNGIKEMADNLRKDTQSFCSYVRSNSRCNDRDGPLKDVNGDELGMCHIFKKIVISVFAWKDSTKVLMQFKQRYLGSIDGMLNLI